MNGLVLILFTIPRSVSDRRLRFGMGSKISSQPISVPLHDKDGSGS